jgi:hypothetical protein
MHQCADFKNTTIYIPIQTTDQVTWQMKDIEDDSLNGRNLITCSIQIRSSKESIKSMAW